MDNPDEWITLGSASGCEIVIDHPTVAPEHAQIRRQGNALMLCDFKSPAGTFVGAEQVAPGRPRPLRHGDQVRLGEVLLTFSAPLAAAAPEAASAFLADVTRDERPAPLVEGLVWVPEILQAVRRIHRVEALVREVPEVPTIPEVVEVIHAKEVDADGMGKDLRASVPQVGQATMQVVSQPLPAFPRLAQSILESVRSELLDGFVQLPEGNIAAEGRSGSHDPQLPVSETAEGVWHVLPGQTVGDVDRGDFEAGGLGEMVCFCRDEDPRTLQTRFDPRRLAVG